MKVVTKVGLVLFAVVLVACLLGNHRISAGLKATQADEAAVQNELKKVETTPEFLQMENALIFLKGVEEWHKLEGWFQAHAAKQREELKGSSGAIEWSGQGLRP